MAKLSHIESRKARAMETTAQRLARVEAMVDAIYLKTFGKPFGVQPVGEPEAAPVAEESATEPEAAPVAEESATKKRGK